MRRTSFRKRSPARSDPGEGDDPEEPELPPRGHPPTKKIKRLLDEIRTEVGAAKKARDKSPGGTPKSSIQKNLAKLGLLDSPQREHPLSILEEFFNQFAEGKDMGLTEEGVRANLAVERGMSLREITQGLLKQALDEQAKGQRGLSKFVRAWQQSSTRTSSPSSLARGSSVPSCKTVDSPDRALPATPPGPPPALPISNPGIYGMEDRKAGAAEGASSFESIAKAIQSQSAQIASLVKSHAESAALPPGTVKRLNRTATSTMSSSVQESRAADFVPQTDAELDAYVMEIRANKTVH